MGWGGAGGVGWGCGSLFEKKKLKQNFHFSGIFQTLSVTKKRWEKKEKKKEKRKKQFRVRGKVSTAHYVRGTNQYVLPIQVTQLV